jgi:hypothetical protein
MEHQNRNATVWRNLSWYNSSAFFLLFHAEKHICLFDLIHIAPKDCLQYFTSVSGKVSSFNWQDVAATSTRQLNNQNYNICFRTEVVLGSV